MSLENIYKAVTEDIEVEVIPLYIPEQTQFENQHLFTYNVSITNHSQTTCKLLRRHWIIMDGLGRREDVEGEGVVGEQPTLVPGDNYQYSSYCPIPTPTGNMRGSFLFEDDNGNNFSVKVPLFFLRPDTVLQ
ncbi:MAG: Co2+/Mg2+ efflux protein ApaG [Pseudomonadota bacterium]